VRIFAGGLIALSGNRLPFLVPIVPPSKTQKQYDVIVVGSGAAGGQTAYTLCMEGVKVLMLEAGRNYDYVAETPMFQTNFDAPLRGAGTTDKPFGFYDSTIDGGWQVPGEPYSQASTDKSNEFKWWRARMLGGRTNHWGRISLRNGEYDFKPRTRDGLGFDWPLTYADVAPYYDKVQMLIGVYGSNEGMENTPDSPDGCLLPPPAARVGERLIKQRAEKLGVPVVPIHRAVLTQKLDHKTIPAKLHPGNAKAQAILAKDMEARAACFWATPCFRGCSIRATYQSPAVHLPPAMETGNLDIVVNAMAYEVTVDKAGKATGVGYIDRTTGEQQHVKGKVVVLAASACESVRILLNSKSPRFPDGLANSSGKVGKYVMDTVGSGLSGQIPLLEGMPLHDEDGAGGAHVYSPWWLYKQQLKGELDFARGYHIEISSGRRMPGVGTVRVESFTQGAYGAKLKNAARQYYGSYVHFAGRGEMIPNEKSFCELDPKLKDKWGVPVLRFHWEWSEHETRQAAHMQKTFASIIEAMGGKVMGAVQPDGRKAIAAGGEMIHEVGGTIMGTNPRDSVTNQWCQTWDVKNLYITDGGPFVSNADKNPTLTIMALAWRASDHIVEQLRKGAL
jgi:choline dehydrogenase-like flavoprotein